MIDIHVICTTEPHVIKDCTLSWNNIFLAEIPRYVNNLPKSHHLMNDRPSQVRALSCVFMYSKHPQNTQKIEEK